MSGGLFFSKSEVHVAFLLLANPVYGGKGDGEGFLS